MDVETIFCVLYNKGEKYWNKCYNGKKGAEDQKLRLKK